MSYRTVELIREYPDVSRGKSRSARNTSRFRSALTLFLALAFFQPGWAQEPDSTKPDPVSPEKVGANHGSPERTADGKSGPGAHSTSTDSGSFAISPPGPPLGTFPKQLWVNFKNLASSENLAPLLIGVGATGVSSFWDDEIQDYFGKTRQFKELGDVGSVIGHPVTLGALSGSLLLAGYNSNSTRMQSLAFSVAQGLVLDYGMTALLKGVTPRQRPNGEGSASFPSGHTSASVMSAAVISHYYPKTTIPAFVTAGLVGISRVEKNKHYVSDVVAGATLGYIIGRTVVRGTDRMNENRRISWSPVVLPEGGVAVTVLIHPQP